MSAKAFVDTNILVYAHQIGAGERHDVAADLVERLWRERAGVVSTQVLQELYVNLRRKARPIFERSEAARIIDDYVHWHVVVNDVRALREAIDLEKRYQLSFWDALIVHAANAAGVRELYSEDLNHGQSYGSVTVISPFRQP
jgi:predicted nucleic acid-binding protein